MLPRLLLHDGFFLDTRPKGDRKIINSAWQPKDGKNPLRIEIADKNDLVLVANFFNHHFTTTNNLRKALGATYEDMKKFSYDRAATALEKPRSFLVFDGNKLVAAVLRTFYTPNEYYKIFNGELFHKNPKFVIKDDYAEDIKIRGYSLNANRIAVLNETCIAQVGKFLPLDVQNLSFGIAMGVHPKYMRNGLTQYLTYEGYKQAKTFNCNYNVGIAVATASYKAMEKAGTKTIFYFPYKDYKENGKPVFNNISDGSKGCYVMLGKAEDMLQKIEGEMEVSLYKSNL